MPSTEPISVRRMQPLATPVGQILTIAPARVMQLALKLNF